MSVLRNLPVQLLCFVDKESEGQRENVGCSSHTVKSVAEQKLELGIRAPSYFPVLSFHPLVLLPQHRRKTSSAYALCPGAPAFSSPSHSALSLGYGAPAPGSAWSEFKSQRAVLPHPTAQSPTHFEDSVPTECFPPLVIRLDLILVYFGF